ncbi:hypothetical protein ACU4GD_23185 [Cupriavidus basilensis]
MGVFFTVERGGAERIAGVAHRRCPLGSAHRRSSAVAAAADAEAAARRRVSVERRIGAEFEVLDVAWKASGPRPWPSPRRWRCSAAPPRAPGGPTRRAKPASSELLIIRRALADTTLAERVAVVDALEADSRLRLDLHRMWDFDDEARGSR